jgi:hypothetical protein
MCVSKIVKVFSQSILHMKSSPYSSWELYLGHDMKSIKPPHHVLDNLAVSNMELTKSVNVRFFFSVTRFFGVNMTTSPHV